MARTASKPRKRAGKRKRQSPQRNRALVKKGARASPKHRKALVAKAGGVTITEVAELDDLRRELERASGGGPLRWNADPDDVQRSVAQLVLTLVEFIRKLLERQAIRRMESGTLTDGQTEDIGRALMQLEAAVRDLAARFGIPIEDLNLDLGPAGKLI
jgi:gas vesicle protein GvpK